MHFCAVMEKNEDQKDVVSVQVKLFDVYKSLYSSILILDFSPDAIALELINNHFKKFMDHFIKYVQRHSWT